MTELIDTGLEREIIALARLAGAEVMRVYETDFEVRTKADSSPVTEADEAAEAVILAGLERLAPGIPVIAEEAYGAGHRPDTGGGVFWLVDALDGTKEFVKRNGEFTVNIGLVERGAPVFGVVHAPALGTTYWGRGKAAFASEAGAEPQPISARPPPAAGLTVITSRTHRGGEAEFLKDFTVNEQIHTGSSVKFCLIARGRADIYPRLGPTSEWDTGAGDAVLRAAGGRVETLDGALLTYGKQDFHNPEFVARGGAAEPG